MDSLPDASPLPPISTMLAGVVPDVFDDPVFPDDGSSLLSSAQNTLMTPFFHSSLHSSAVETTTTSGSTIFKRKMIKRKNYVFELANGLEYISNNGKPCWRFMQSILHRLTLFIQLRIGM